MRKGVFFLLVVSSLLAFCAHSAYAQADGQQAATAAPEAVWSKAMVESRGASAMLGYTKGTTRGKSVVQTTRYASGRWDYVPGLVAKALLKYNKQYPSSGVAEGSPYMIAKSYADNAVQESDAMPLKVGSENGYSYFVKGSIDAIASSKILIDLYEETHDVKYKKAAKWVYDYLVGNGSDKYPRITQELGRGGFCHKSGYPNQMWLDGLFMGAAYYAEYLDAFDKDNADGWLDIANQFEIIHEHTWDAEKKLNYHAWAAKVDADSFWADANGHSKEFWGRGMGWYFAALVDVLELMPQTHPHYGRLLEILAQVADGLKDRQDETHGVWCQLLQYPQGTRFAKGNYKSNVSGDPTTPETEFENYFEASASCMFTYAFLKASRLGLIDKEIYQPVGEKAFLGIQEQFIRMEDDGLTTITGICRSAGLGARSNTYRDGTPQYYLFGKDASEIAENEGKGVGPYIMAALEYEMLLAERASSISAVEISRAPSVNTYNVLGQSVGENYKGLAVKRGKKIFVGSVK